MHSKRRKYLILLLALSISIRPIGLFSQEINALSKAIVAANANGKYLNHIKTSGQLIVGMIETDQYPFFYINNRGSLVGLDVDIARELARTLQVELQIDRSAKSFGDLIPLVASGAIDLAISKLSRNLSRSQEILFSNPYVIFRQALLINRIQLTRVSSSDEETKEVLRDFFGKIGVIRNSSYERYAELNFPKAEIVTFPTWEETLESLAKGEVFAVYRDEMEIGKYMSANPSQTLYFKSVVIQDRKDPIAIAMPSDAYHLQFYINLFLETLDFLPEDSAGLLKKFESKHDR